MDAEGRAALTHRPGVVWADVDGEIVVYDPERGLAFLLSMTGSLLWPHFSGFVDPQELAEDVADVFAIGADQAADQIAVFCQQLVSSGLLVAKEHQSEAPCRSDI